jgi:hypothetical protein
MYKNINLSLLLLFLLSLGSFAQTNEWTKPYRRGDIIWDGSVGIGSAPIKYSDKVWENQSITSQGGNGITADINGTYMFSDKYGVAVGLGVSQYNSQLSLATYSGVLNGLIDVDDMAYNLITDANGIEEEHDLFSLDIPVKFQAYIPLGSRIEFIGGAGLKLNLPISANYELNQIQITTKAFYPDLNFMLSDYEDMGLFTDKTDWQQNGDLNSKLNVSVLLEAGIAVPVGDRLALSCKGYFSHGLSSAIENEQKTYLVVENSEYNGLQSFLGDAKLMQVGFKLGVVLYGK